MTKPAYWLEITIKAGTDAREMASALLFTLGCTGTQEKQDRLVAWFDPRGRDIRRLKAEVGAALSRLEAAGFPFGKFSWRRIRPRDWNRAWRAWFQPVAVTDSLRIRPAWERATANAGDLFIMPRMAFGTGTHETTQLCMIQLEKIIGRGDGVLDIGTGSGILAIAACKLHAGTVTAFDVDSDAIANAVENAALNRVSHAIHFFQGTLGSLRPRPYHIIAANIDTPVLLSLLPVLGDYLADSGRIILSGILRTESGRVQSALEANGYRIAETTEKGEWIAITAVTGGR